MKDELTLMRLIPGERQEVFGYFVTPELLEQWAYPDGKQIFSNLETVTTFSQRPGGTFVTITQRGLPDESFLKECETGQNQCLDHLTSLLSGREERPAQSA